MWKSKQAVPNYTVSCAHNAKKAQKYSIIFVIRDHIMDGICFYIKEALHDRYFTDRLGEKRWRQAQQEERRHKVPFCNECNLKI
jgi:hypothetical protein